MPTVTRSDCTEIDATERFKITYDTNTNVVEGSIVLIDVNFNSCQGINNRNNDLWAYMGRLYYEGKIENTQWGKAGRIITNSDCDFAVEEALSKQALAPGYDYDVSKWTNVAGRDNMNVIGDANELQVATFGAEALRLALTTQTANPAEAPYGIIRRSCATCDPEMKDIYYRRLTPIPEGFDLLHNILHQRNDGGGNNRWGVDFSLHSTYEDAVNNVNAWLCPGNSFNYGAPFYGECSPSGDRVRDQYSIFSWFPGPRAHVGYYINKGEDEGMVKVDTNPIKGHDFANGMALQSADGKTIYMTGHGRDIWNTDDDFNFKAGELVAADFTAVVKVGARSTKSPQSWSKVGLMVRTDLESNSAHFSVYRTGQNWICTQGRRSKGEKSISFGDCVQNQPDAAWFKIEKRMNMYTSFYGSEGADGVITWTRVKYEVIDGIGDNSYVGLAVSSASYWQLEAVFEDFEVSQYFFPSAAPSISMAPTFPPSLSAMHSGADGCPKNGAAHSKQCFSNTALHAVSCCSGSQTDGNLSCSRPNCFQGQKMSFTDAAAHCASAAMRLCTAAELQSNVCCGKGCSFDSDMGWTADSCTAHTGTDGCPSSGTAHSDVCLDDTALKAVNCCSGSQSDGNLSCSRPNCFEGQKMSFTDAVAHCESAAMRLCTVAELKTNECCGKGCNFDSDMGWTADNCG